MVKKNETVTVPLPETFLKYRFNPPEQIAMITD